VEIDTRRQEVAMAQLHPKLHPLLQPFTSSKDDPFDALKPRIFSIVPGSVDAGRNRK